MIHFVVYWLLCILLLFISAADRTLGLNEDANMTVKGSSCIEKERQALLKLKADLIDIHDILNNWSDEEEMKKLCCFWWGVTCDFTGHVTDLDIAGFQFGGKINPSIKVLKQLQTLDLSGNDFQSNYIPNFLGSLTNLQHLDMSNANLSGPIPHELGNLSNLNYLDLSGNSLVGSIPVSFGALTSLVTLDLSTNQLGGVIPHQFENLSNLSILNLSVNLLRGSLPDFTKRTSLVILSLAHNFLNGSIPDITGYESLEELDLSSNQLGGELPNSLGQLSNLEYLNISSNSLHGVISDLHFLNLSSLTYLDMSLNSFSFKLSYRLRVPFQLKIINLKSCKLGPSFPMWIKTQKDFKDLDISSAGISDRIPVWFWDLPLGLRYLNLSSNEFEGTLPDMTLKFHQCPGLDLSNNRLEGSLPDCWSQFQNLVVLDLSNNNLSGKIPHSFRLLYLLEALYLRKNAFVGELPMSLSNCTNLRFADLGENKLSGKIPSWVGERLTRLYVLVLRSNMLSGSLPTQICWLYNLHILDLSKNRLVGNVPRCFRNLTSMSSRRSEDYLTNHTYYSYLSIFLPPEISKLNPEMVPQEFIDNALVAWKGTDRSFGRSNLELLKIIDLSNNNLSGELPIEITRLVKLVSLNISFNKLHGELPKDIGMLTSLESLDLSRNQFSGKIPSSLSELHGLAVLDLSYNNLSGKIPSGTQLQGFNSSSYEGNTLLYGPPLTPISGPTPGTTIDDEDDTDLHGDDDFWNSYYMGMGSGFAVGFWGICGLIFLNHRCRHFLFASLSLAKDWIYVTVVVLFRKFKRL
ncbi:receptor-like protein EIX2 isoform X2 [Rutidosis leptorrhynchoides]|uniref:receptor-like protein EIX2 isoform X2 n=1 Tax=Rutidosis leptorrhynchoides TaxID=125765 RepID=UPI003A999F65